METRLGHSAPLPFIVLLVLLPFPFPSPSAVVYIWISCNSNGLVYNTSKSPTNKSSRFELAKMQTCLPAPVCQLLYCTTVLQGTVRLKMFSLFWCLFFLCTHYLCEKYHKPIMYLYSDSVIEYFGLFVGLTNWTCQHTLRRELVCMYGTYYTHLMKVLVEGEMRLGCKYFAGDTGFLGTLSPEPWSKTIVEIHYYY